MIDKRIIGTWRLRSTKAVDDDGKALPPPLGPAPNGVSCFQADGRMYSVICDGRAALPRDEQRVFISYTGNYTFDGDTLSTRVDAASDASRIGGACEKPAARAAGSKNLNEEPCYFAETLISTAVRNSCSQESQTHELQMRPLPRNSVATAANSISPQRGQAGRPRMPVTAKPVCVAI